MSNTAVDTPKIGFDDIPLSRFHIKIMGMTYGGHFQDGFSLGVIGIGLTAITPSLNLSTLWTGLIASSALIGLFFGSLFMGMVAEKYGRAKIFTVNFIIISVCTFLQLFVQTAEQLFVLRVMIGLGLGGDYSVGHAMLVEYLPRKSRGTMLGAFAVVWTSGYALATVVGWLMQDNLIENWRWMLFTAFPFAAIILILRIGTPESPRWLMSKGRLEEANAIVHKYFGNHVTLDDELVGAATMVKGKFSDLFGPKLIRRTAFNCIFTACQVVPYFAIFTFLPTILKQFGLADNIGTALLLNGFLVLGTFWGMYCTAKLTRRAYAIASFFGLAVFLFALGLIPPTMPTLFVTLFALFTLNMSGANNLFGIYPSESFPTEVRAMGVGLATASSRIGAVVGTFLLPFSLDKLGMTGTMAWISGILVFGGIVSILWAPETKFGTLREASSGDGDLKAIKPVAPPNVVA